MKYYSILRPVVPGSYPKDEAGEIHSYGCRLYIDKIGREAWGWIDYPEGLDEKMANSYDLIPGGRDWWSVTITSKHNGGGIVAAVTESKRSDERPKDERWDTSKRGFKRRWFESLEQAKEVEEQINSLEVKFERCRTSVTSDSHYGIHTTMYTTTQTTFAGNLEERIYGGICL